MMRKQIGACVPLTNWGFYTPSEILEYHEEMLKKNGKIYLSTSNKLSYQKASSLDFLLLVNKSGLRYIAEIEDYTYYENKGIPDANEYIIEDFKTADRHWFLLNELHVADTATVKKLKMYNTNLKYNNPEDYILNSGRLQIFYITRD